VVLALLPLVGTSYRTSLRWKMLLIILLFCHTGVVRFPQCTGTKNLIHVQDGASALPPHPQHNRPRQMPPAAVNAVAAIAATISNVTVSPTYVPYASGEAVKFDYMVNVNGTSSSKFIDTLVHICHEDYCMTYKGGHFDPSTGSYAASAKIMTDEAFWMAPPGDFPPGSYPVQIIVCDGPCVKFFAKPTVLSTANSGFIVKD
jgi:hypothetical protein